MAKVTPQRDILTAEQAAEMLQISKLMTYRLIRSGQLQAVRVGKFWRVTRNEILRMCGDKQ